MRNLTRYLLWAYVFTVPWDNFLLPLVGSVSRLVGLAVVGAGVLTVIAEGQFRKPDAVLGFGIAFSVWTALSLLWTLSYANTIELAPTFLQLAASVWVIREFVRTREELQPLLVALLFGLFVPLVDLLNNFRLSTGIYIDGQRFTGVGFNADLAGLLLALGLPIAWHLLMHCRGLVWLAALAYLVTAPVGLLLTATRGAFVAALAALSIIPLTLPRQSLRSYALAGVLLVLGALSATLVVPQYNWERILSTGSEITERGSMSGRREIWNAGLQAFPTRPLLGAGAGAYGAAVDPYIRNVGARAGVGAHNVAIGLLVEEGIVGLILFAGIFGACAWTIFHTPPPNGALCGVLLLTWLVGGLSGSPEALKFTWVLFGLVSAQSGLARTVTDVSTDGTVHVRASAAMPAPPLHRNRRSANLPA
jgi:O-antigen ligase